MNLKEAVQIARHNAEFAGRSDVEMAFKVLLDFADQAALLIADGERLPGRVEPDFWRRQMAQITRDAAAAGLNVHNPDKFGWPRSLTGSA